MQAALSLYHLMTLQHLRTIHLHFTFSCHGNGTILFWTVDGYTTREPYALSKQIQPTSYIVSPAGLTVLSQLIVPTTKANRDITVICSVLDTSYQSHSNNPVRLTLPRSDAVTTLFKLQYKFSILDSSDFICSKYNDQPLP